MRRKDDLEMFHQYNVYTPKRIVTVSGDIDEWSIAEAIKNLTVLDMSSDDPITILLNTPGGDVYNGLALYDTIRGCRSEVSIVGLGYLMSMGTIIMQAADKDRRYLTKNCRIMLHYGAAGMDANYKDFLAAAHDAKALMDRTNQILFQKIKEKKPRFTMKQLDALLQVDNYMWPNKFIELGLADNIIGEE